MSAQEESRLSVLFETDRLKLLKRDGQEFVRRKGVSGVVAVVAFTLDKEILLLEQERLALGRSVIELPGGMAGDVPGKEDESLEEAASRELMEETGYAARQWIPLGEGPSSSGLTDEIISFYLAWPAIRRADPGEGERSTLHRVPLMEMDAWLERRRAEGRIVDYRIHAGLYFIKVYLDVIGAMQEEDDILSAPMEERNIRRPHHGTA